MKQKLFILSYVHRTNQTLDKQHVGDSTDSDNEEKEGRIYPLITKKTKDIDIELSPLDGELEEGEVEELEEPSQQKDGMYDGETRRSTGQYIDQIVFYFLSSHQMLKKIIERLIKPNRLQNKTRLPMEIIL